MTYQLKGVKSFPILGERFSKPLFKLYKFFTVYESLFAVQNSHFATPLIQQFLLTQIKHVRIPKSISHSPGAHATLHVREGTKTADGIQMKIAKSSIT
jgi:hypothetical protein